MYRKLVNEFSFFLGQIMAIENLPKEKHDFSP
jgi:hypothetical protein